jgi:hypothetical protein
MTQRKMTVQRELPVSGIKPHILVMNNSEKDDIPEGAASFRYQTTYSNDGEPRRTTFQRELPVSGSNHIV